MEDGRLEKDEGWVGRGEVGEEKMEGMLSGKEVCHDGRDKETGGTLKQEKKTG